MPFTKIAEHSVRTPILNVAEIDLVTLLIPAFVGFGISQVILGLLLINRSENKTFQQKFYAGLLISLLGFFIAPFTVASDYHIISITVMTAIPGLFWLFCLSLFDDHFRLKSWQLSLVVITVFLPFIELLNRQLGYDISPALFFVLHDIPTMLELLLVGLALVAIARHWRVDLIQSRRDLRLWFCGVNGVYLFTILLLREAFYPYFTWLDYGQYASAGIIVLVTNVMFLRISSGILVKNATTNQRLPMLKLDKAEEVAPQAIIAQGNAAQEVAAQNIENKLAPSIAEDQSPLQEPGHKLEQKQTSQHWVIDNSKVDIPQEALEQIRCALEEECVYRDMDITIGLLAYRLEIPEYKLRAVINSGLGYRNFNDFLNSYRIKEVAKRLVLTEDSKHSVLTIALDAGFRSLSSFNKIFKSTYDITPTAYRRKFSDKLKN